VQLLACISITTGGSGAAGKKTAKETETQQFRSFVKTYFTFYNVNDNDNNNNNNNNKTQATALQGPVQS